MCIKKYAVVYERIERRGECWSAAHSCGVVPRQRPPAGGGGGLLMAAALDPAELTFPPMELLSRPLHRRV